MMPQEEYDGAPEGGVPLAAAVEALRIELTQAFAAGKGKSLRFVPAPVELTLQVAMTTAGSVKAGVRWWLISAGGEASRQSVATQTVKLTLDPRLFDADDNPVDLLVEADESLPDSRTDDIPLGAHN
ncbi:hypothetical protein EV651_1285 [Kribbella sp. VKM Ac-2571]|uniref:trypco2 family protein n=1 Tax=Kribbella sp. VKM Ac-2571 TaxID=2512222 RepID=UPI00105E2057|nr:trypco2 family protein [Kribbella sp. VKM Ac-2571]TDO45616.1 hypothetical protein EV651_1285 [Kribbella sp. VKM Ac-2571]